MQPERDNVFISYTHKDDRWRQQIHTALAPLLRNGAVKAWDDTNILPGSAWRDEIEQALSHTKVGLLLVSADSLASDFIMTKELPALESAAGRGELRLLWVLVRDCLWRATPLVNYQAVLDPSTPLSAMSARDREVAIVQICEKVDHAYRSPAVAITDTSPGAKTGQSQSVHDIIRDGSAYRLAALAEEHAAAVRQLAETNDAVQRLRLERQIAGIELEMSRLNRKRKG